MELTILNKLFYGELANKKINMGRKQNLTNAAVNVTYIIKGINTDDKAMKDFLFTLGCFEGEKATLISVLAENYIINIKDSRYSIDADLAEVILI